MSKMLFFLTIGILFFIIDNLSFSAAAWPISRPPSREAARTGFFFISVSSCLREPTGILFFIVNGFSFSAAAWPISREPPSF
jgi:hypothetical protein